MNDNKGKEAVSFRRPRRCPGQRRGPEVAPHPDGSPAKWGNLPRESRPNPVNFGFSTSKEY